MRWNKKCLFKPQYEYTSSNQYGDRYKMIGSKKFSIANISCETNDSNGLTKLILLSHTLDVPVHYDFEEHRAYIEVVSAMELKNL